MAIKKRVHINELILGCNILQTMLFRLKGDLQGQSSDAEDIRDMKIAADVLMNGVRRWIKQENE